LMSITLSAYIYPKVRDSIRTWTISTRDVNLIAIEEEECVC
jgi:hypothetical protein